MIKPKTSGVIDAVTDLGLPIDGSVDCYSAIMASIRGLTGPARYDFPAGTFVFNRPIIAGPYAPDFQGAGMTLTKLSAPYYRRHPVLIFGLREINGTNQVTAANRPDAFGKLDNTWSGAPGGRTGFRTLGTTWAIAQGHPLSLGSQSSAHDGMWSYHSEDSQWTLEVAMTFNGGFLGDHTLMGLGDASEGLVPWTLGTTSDHQFIFTFKTLDMSEEPNTGANYLSFVAPPEVDDPTAVIRIRIWFDFDAGTFGSAVNGIDIPFNWWGYGTPVNLKDKRFARNRGRYPFLIGTGPHVWGGGDTNVPDFTVWALRISAVAIKTEPANDSLRYYEDFDTTVTWFPGTGSPGRDMDMSWGGANGGSRGSSSILLVPANAHVGILGGGVRDMTIENGSPGILIVQVLSPFILERVRCRYGTVGISALWGYGPCYSMVMNNCEVQGSDCGMALWNCEIAVDGLLCASGGITSFRFAGGNSYLRNMFIARCPVRQETAFEFLPSSWGANILLDTVLFDNEDTLLSGPAVRIAQSAYVGPMLVEIKRLLVAQSGPVPLVQLTGHAPDGGAWQTGQFKGEMWNVGGTNYPAALDVGPGWLGTLDVRTLTNQTVTGVGADKIDVVGATTTDPAGETERRLDAIEKWLAAIAPFPKNLLNS